MCNWVLATFERMSAEAYLEVQAVMQQAAGTVLRHCPESTDRDHAMRQLRDARMWANASIALEGRY